MKSFGLLLALGLPISAQVYTPPEPKPAPSTPSDTAPASKKKESESPFGNEVPLLDPSAETVTVAGITIPLGDSRVIKARFEKYLNEPAENSEEAQQYRDDIDKILDLLSPQRLASLSGSRDSSPSLAEAFKLLPQAASYPGDARLSSTLAESIYTAMLAKQDSKNLRLINAKMDGERKRINNTADEMARNERGKDIGKEKKVTEDKGTKTTTEHLPRSRHPIPSLCRAPAPPCRNRSSQKSQRGPHRGLA